MADQAHSNSEPSDLWGEKDGKLLKRARKSLGQSQMHCAEILSELGASDCGQQAVSDWERGRTHRPRPENLPSIRRYIAESGIDVDREEAPASSATVIRLKPAPTLDEAIESRSEIGRPGMTHDDLNRAIGRRIETGPALSDADNEAIKELRSNIR